MIRPLLCILTALPLLAHADLKSELAAKYHTLDQAIARKDTRAVSNWIAANTTSDFTYTSHDKNRFTRPQFEKGLRDQIAVTKRIKTAATMVVSVKQAGSTATVGTDSNTEATVVFDTKPMRLVDKSHTVDTWVRLGNGWRLKKSVQTKADTQMFQQ